MPEAEHPLRVMHVIGRLIPGGVERRTLELIKFTRGSGVEHHVLVASGMEGSLDEEYRSAGVKLHYLSVRRPSFSLRFIRLLRREDIAVVHSNIMYTSGFLLALARIANVRGRIAHFQSDGRRSLAWTKRLQYRILRRLIDAFATEIVGLTPEGLSVAWDPSWGDDPRSSVIANGILLEAFATNTRTDLLAPAGAGPVFIHVGRGDLETKNRQKAVTVFAELAARFPESVLVFVGRDGLEASAAELHRQNLLSQLPSSVSPSRVRFVGEVDNVAEYLAAADLFLFTSSLEGLPGVVIEAFASGLPVVATPLPGVRFIVDSIDNAAVRLLDLRDSDLTWADSIQKTLEESSPADRASRARGLKDGIFDLSLASKAYVRLWRQSGKP